MVAAGTGFTKRGGVWCAGLLVAGLLLLAAEADYCSEGCRGKVDFLGCARRCRSQLEVARPTNCVALCHGKPNFMACCSRYRHVRRALPHLKLAGGESATHEEVLTAMAARLSDACQVFCHNHEHYDWCVRRCRFGPHLRLAGGGGESEEARGGAVGVLAAALSSFCGDYCRTQEPNVDYRYCVRRCEFGPRRASSIVGSASHHHLHLPAGAGGSNREGEAVDVLTAPPRPDCEALCTYWAERGDDYQLCLRRCRSGGLGRVPLHDKLAGGVSKAQEEEEGASGEAVAVQTAAAAVAVVGGDPDICQEFCHDWPDFDGCLEFCLAVAYVQPVPPHHLKLAGGESTKEEEEEATGGAVDIPKVRIPDRCVFFCRNRGKEYDACLFTCRTGAPARHKLAGGGAGESTTQKEEAPGGAVHVPAAAEVHHEAVAGAQPMDSADPCEDYCMEQTRYFPGPGRFFDCVEECHAGHGGLAGDGGNGIPAAAAQNEAAAGAQPVNTETCEAYCKRHARDFPAKQIACVRQCESGGHPGDGARAKQERRKKHGKAILAVAPAR